MRFYPQSRTTRLIISALWLLVAVFWLYAMRHHHGSWGTLQKVIWVILPVIQMISMWTYWEITSTELRHQAPIVPARRFPLRDLVYAGDVRRSTGKWALKNSTEVQFNGTPILYIGVADRDRFRAELNGAQAREA
jgi:hypothetical protein